MGRTSHTSCATQLVFMEQKVEELEAEKEKLRQALEEIKTETDIYTKGGGLGAKLYHIAKAALESE